MAELAGARDLNLDHLRTFTIVADVSSFTRAAHLIHLTQSAVSQQMRELENRLGVSLFERRGRHLVLSPAGEALKPLAVRVMGNIREIESELAPFKGKAQGLLNLGATSTPGIYLLPYALDAYSQAFPNVKVSLRVAERSALVQGLSNGELDLVVMDEDPAPGELPGLEKIPLIEEELVIIVPKDHRWASLDEIDVSSLVEEPFILRPRDTSIRQLHGNVLATRGFHPERLTCRFEVGSTEAIKHSVLAGLGAGFVYRSSIGAELGAGLLAEVRIRGITIGQTIWILKPARRKHPPHLQPLLELLNRRDWIPVVLQQRLHADRKVHVTEVRVMQSGVVNISVQDLQLPGNCLLALIKRSGEVFIPDGRTVLQLGDTVTLIGIYDAVEQVRRRLEGPRT
ncbi:MAG: LysR substrate-binding domain-containing protein [bacterium]|nr:LysR substrate-binding domain-containing protein [bacterium]